MLLTKINAFALEVMDPNYFLTEGFPQADLRKAGATTLHDPYNQRHTHYRVYGSFPSSQPTLPCPRTHDHGNHGNNLNRKTKERRPSGLLWILRLKKIIGIHWPMCVHVM